MAAQQRCTCNNVMEYCTRVHHSRNKCNMCPFTTNGNLRMEAHLFHRHNIYTLQGKFIWEYKSESSPWLYFTVDIEDKFFATCTKCKRTIKVHSKSNLVNHLKIHSNIINEIREEITSTWLSQYFDLETHEAKCMQTSCVWSIALHNGPDSLEDHLNIVHNINKYQKSDEGTGNYNVGAMIQQSAAEENYATTSSYHNNRHGRASGNQEDQQRFPPSTSSLISDANFHGTMHAESETGTFGQMKPPEQETGITDNSCYQPAPSSPISMEDEDAFTLFESEIDDVLDVSELTKSFERRQK